jgi:hypothetical protein
MSKGLVVLMLKGRVEKYFLVYYFFFFILRHGAHGLWPKDEKESKKGETVTEAKETRKHTNKQAKLLPSLYPRLSAPYTCCGDIGKFFPFLFQECFLSRAIVYLATCIQQRKAYWKFSSSAHSL